jgi:tRNA(fMet)-specific endonuclease VapC
MDQSMENGELILLDTSILIDYFRKTKKENSFFVELSDKYDFFAISVITKFEIYYGSNQLQKDFWDIVFENLTILPLSEKCIDEAISIQNKLKAVGLTIDFADLLIAATAKHNGLNIATLNVKHFNRIADLQLVTKVI